MLSHLFLILVLIFLVLLINVTSSPMPGGDYGVGYAFAMIIYGAGFIIFSGLLFWNMYDKIPVPTFLQSVKPVAVVISWLSFILTICALSVFRTEWHPGEFPRILKVLSDANGHIILSIMILLPFLLYMHHKLAQSQASWFTPGLFYPAITVTVFIALIVGWGFVSASHKQNINHQKESADREKAIRQEYWNTLDNFSPSDPLVYILSLTGRYHDEDIRAAAVAKVKSNPGWENELINLLATPDYIPYVYQFIDGNKIDHPLKFIIPVKNSLDLLAQTISDQMRNSNNLQDWHFESMSIERCLRAIDEQFSQNGGTEFVQPIQKVLSSLQGHRPERFKDVRFTTEKPIREWLKKHNR